MDKSQNALAINRLVYTHIQLWYPNNVKKYVEDIVKQVKFDPKRFCNDVIKPILEDHEIILDPQNVVKKYKFLWWGEAVNNTTAS
jgi:hypothetical protein